MKISWREYMCRFKNMFPCFRGTAAADGILVVLVACKPDRAEEVAQVGSACRCRAGSYPVCYLPETGWGIGCCIGQIEPVQRTWNRQTGPCEEQTEDC